MKPSFSLRSVFVALVCSLRLPAAEPPIPPVPDKQPEPPFAPAPAGPLVRMLVPGFTVRELPVTLTSLNNIEYAPDGRLFAGGYDGRFHLLRDLDGDGLEEKVDTFSPEPSANYPLGLAVKDGALYTVLTDEIVRFTDPDGDGVPDKRETVHKGFDDPALIAAPYLNHRRVDSSMALALGPDGSLYVTMGNAGFNNPYWTDKHGVAHYSPEKRRGCLLRFTPEGKVEQLASGLRYIMSLQWNRHGDLFGTEQEGATWVPNGNPFDELLHLQPGRHYGFPPRHPKWLPSVIDEPSTWDYAPQHQSTCGFRFNGPAPGRGRFGPESWAEDAIVTGESRGKLWRTKLAKTAAGYVARTELFAALSLLAVDCAISLAGDLVICCHTGKPDWGNGPKGAGRIFKISYDGKTPQPVLAWPASDTQTIVAFDRPLAAAAPKVTIEAGRYVAAGERFETMRPGYAVVQMQQRQPREAIPVKATRVSNDRRALIIDTAARAQAVNYALTFGATDLAHDLSGVAAEWQGGGAKWTGWLPHLDFAAARELTRSSAIHDEFWKRLETPGSLDVIAQLDLTNMLQPVTQPISQLDYTPAPEVVTVVFKSDADFVLDAFDVRGAKVKRVSPRETRLTIAGSVPDRWHSIRLQINTPVRAFDVSFTTPLDSHARPLGTARCLVPFAKPTSRDVIERAIPEIAGGDWKNGRVLFAGKAACATCHVLRGEGVNVGPDLNNLVHRDYASVVRDLVEPSAAINPDAAGYTVTMKDGAAFAGTRVGENADEFHLAQPGGAVARLKRRDIAKTEPMAQSLMPAGLLDALTPQERKDLLTYLLTEPRKP